MSLDIPFKVAKCMAPRRSMTMSEGTTAEDSHPLHMVTVYLFSFNPPKTGIDENQRLTINFHRVYYTTYLSIYVY
jgi:hypothetical protein